MITKHMDTFWDITESLESEREEPSTAIAAEAVPTSQAWKSDLVAFALAEAVRFSEQAGGHLLHDKVCILCGKHLVPGLY